MYAVSFDTHAYAFEAETGRVRWKTPVGNFVASSPAVGPDGTVYFASFDGHVYALDGRTGEVVWKHPTGGPIYASPAITQDGVLYVGSSDGLFYAISTERRETLWTFYTGDAIRCSAAIGPDPEQRTSGNIIAHHHNPFQPAMHPRLFPALRSIPGRVIGMLEPRRAGGRRVWAM